MNKSLMLAVLEMAMFFELSEDDVIDPDIAVNQLEQLGSILQNLSPGDREELIAYTRELAAEEQRSGQEERADFLLSFGDNFGLSDENTE